MQYFRGGSALEVIAVRFDAGEDLVERLGQVVTDLGLAAGVVLAGCGTLEHTRLETPAAHGRPLITTTTERSGVLLLVSAQGHVIGGGVDLHISVSRRGELSAGKALAGTRVLDTVELTLLRVGNTRWTRVPHVETGVAQWQAAGGAASVPDQPIVLRGRPLDLSLLGLIPRALLQKHACLPVARSENTLVVAMVDPNNPFALDELREATGLRIQAVGLDARELIPALREVLGRPDRAG